LIDAAGNKWTLTSTGVVDENGTAISGGSGTSAFAIVNNVLYGQDATSKSWFIYSPTSQSWTSSSAPVLTSTPTPTATRTPNPTPTPTTGTRDPSQTPFASTSIFNLPLGSGAQWTYNAQLASANVYVNTTASGYNENIYTGVASDPLVTITDNGSVDGIGGTFKVHIPVGAVPAGGTDNSFSIDDTSTHTWYSFGQFVWTSATTATVDQGSAESDYGSGVAYADSDWDQGVGTLRESDLQAGTIDHMLRIQLPTDMLMSYSNSVTQLAPNAWPQTAEDGFAINGAGGTPYSGTVPFGVTIGIPANALEPADVAANAGANMLWHALQDHGAMIRDSAGSGNTVTFQADQNVNWNDPLILGMEQYGAEIMAQTEILANQGPNSINGGGTPIVPLDPAPSDAPGTSTTAAAILAPTAAPTPTPTPTPTATASPNDTMVLAGATTGIIDASGNAWTITSGGQVAVNGIADTTTANVTELAYVNQEIWQENASNLWWSKASPAAPWTSGADPLPPAITIASGTASDTVAQSEVSIAATSGNHVLFLSGSDNIVSLSGGADTVTDSGRVNTYVLPASGNGTVTFSSNILSTGDTLDLKAALAATDWNGSASTLPKYLTVADSATSATLSIAATSGGSGVAIATIDGASSATLTSLLAHAIT
jgi:hypothetical protein